MRKIYTYLIALQLLLFFYRANAQADSLAQPDSVQAVEPPRTEELPAEPVAVEQSTLADIEDLSYRMYLGREWSRLLHYCEHTFENNVDYYYLRMRAGIAAFELGQYRRAALHLEAARNFDGSSQVALEYLYYCYLYTARPEEAARLSLDFDESLKQKTNTISSWPLMSAGAESGVKSVKQAGYENGYYSGLNLAHSLRRKASLYHMATYYTQREQRFNVQQVQYYIRTIVPLEKGYRITAGIHAINMLLQTPTYSAVTVSGTFQPITPGGNLGPPQPGQSTRHETVMVNSQSVSAIGALTLSKETPRFGFSIGTSAALLDTVIQTQGVAGINFYPLQNNKITLGANVYFHSEDFYTPDLAYSPFITLAPSKRFLITATYFANTGNNISEYNASLVTNSIDYTLQRWSLTLSAALSEQAWIFFSYGNESKKHITKGFGYTYTNLSGGFKILLN